MPSYTRKLKNLGRHATGVLAVSALCIAAGTSTALHAQDAIKWKVQSTFNTAWPALGDPIARVSETLKEVTDGRINLKIFEPGKIVPPLEISPSISRGDLPAAYNYLAYDQGRIPSAVLFSAVPFGMEPWEYAAWWFEDEGAQLAADLYHEQNIHPLLCSTIGPETAGWYRKPITQLSDMEGLKIRFFRTGWNGIKSNRRICNTHGRRRNICRIRKRHSGCN